MSRKHLITLAMVLTAALAHPPAPVAAARLARDAGAPTLDQMVGLKRAGSPALSPDSRHVAYTVRDTDWVGNAFVTQVWLADTQTGETRQITQGNKNNTAPAWSPDGRKLAFVSERGEKRQVYMLDMSGGDAVAITAADEGISRFAWSPDGKQIAFAATEPKSKALKDREAEDGDIQLVGEDHRMTHLWVIDIDLRKSRQITNGAFNVGNFRWSPDGARIAFDHTINGDLGADSTADIAVVTVADGGVRQVVTQPGPDVNPYWSPDGQSIAFETTMNAPWHYYANTMIAVVAAGGGTPVPLTRDFDEDVSIVDWTRDGIWFAASQRTATALFHLDPGSRRIEKHTPAADWIGGAFSLDRSGAHVAFVWSDPRHYPEIGVAPTATMQVKTLTRLGDQLKGWPMGTTEVVRWTSRDGAAIEGVLHKPAGWTAGHRRPLMVVIHGGPTAVSRPSLFSSTYVYPIERWVAKGALVLEPNYRGSAGYGAAFRALNVRNLGVGDAWDVVSGIDALIARGLVDSMQVGVCGWSEGGYISAFLATHESTRFRAISVGAGISDWMTYYVNTDITPFTREYLHATPWDDPGIYALTSPITTIKDAHAPTLIQHGSEDARVPTPNGYELYRGLKDVGCMTRLVIYRGFGHGINKPKQIRAAMRHNLEWFDHYLWGEGAAVAEAKPAASAKGGAAKSAAAR